MRRTSSSSTTTPRPGEPFGSCSPPRDMRWWATRPTGARASLRRSGASPLILLDVELPDIDGFEVARQLAAAGHVGATILVSGRSGGYRKRAAESPALGFIPNGELTADALAGLLG